MDPMDVPPLPTPDHLARSPPAAHETPRRSHLRQLSLASTPLTPRSPSSSTPLGGGSTSGASPHRSPLGKLGGSLGRRSGRQSSISYSPSIRSLQPEGGGSTGEGGSGRASPKLSYGSPRSSSEGFAMEGDLGASPSARIPLGDRNGRAVVPSKPEHIEAHDASVARSDVVGTPGRARSRSSLSIGSIGSQGDREPPPTPKEPLTFAEQYASLLSSIARKESTILELKNALNTHESELADLKAQWRDLAATNAAPGVSHPPPSVMDAAEGLLGAETIQGGKRLLSLVLGVGGEDEEEKTNPAASSGSTSSPSTIAPAKVRRSMSGRSSTDLRRSLSGLEQVAEAPEDAPYTDEPIPDSTGIATPTSSSPPSTSAIRSIPGRPTHPRASSSKRLSLLSSTSSISSQSSVDTAPWRPGDADHARVAEEETEEGADGKEVKGLMADLAGSNGGGWGKKFGELAAGLNSNEHFVQSKRASMSFASSLTSSWTAFNTMSPLTLPPLSRSATPPKSPTPPPRSSPSAASSSTPRRLQATKMRPISTAPASRQLTSPGTATSPAGARAPSPALSARSTTPNGARGADSDFFSAELDDSKKSALQAPLAPSGGMPVARLSSPASSPVRKLAAVQVQAQASDAESADDWNW